MLSLLVIQKRMSGYDNIMGQNHSNAATQHKFLGEYQVQARNNELNLTFLSHRHTHQHFLLREMVFSDPIDFEATRRQHQNRLTLTHPVATRLVKVESQQEESICSRVFKFYALWEHSSVTLVDEVNRRGLQRRSFSAQQIARLLSVLARGLLHYCALGCSYEGLVTRSVLVGWDGFKLQDPLMLPYTRNLEVVHSNRNVKNVYLSPEECRAVELEAQGEPWQQTDGVFTAGMIAMEAATLSRQDGCYGQKSSKVNWAIVNQNLQKVGDLYGNQLKQVMGRMLQQDVKKRIGLRELWEKVQSLPQNVQSRANKQQDLSLRAPFTPNNKWAQLVGEKTVVSRLSADRRASITHFSTQKMRLSHAESGYSPQRLVETTHYPNTQDTPTITQQRPRPLLQMKTVNTTYDIQETPSALFSFQRQLPTLPIKQPPTASDNFSSDFEDSVKIRKYQHHSKPLFSPPHPQARYFVEEFKMGSRYEGLKVEGRREGWGKFYFQDGGLYQGQWKDNRMHGFGRLYYQSGKLAYEGHWEADQFSGKGKLYNQSCCVLNRPYDYTKLNELEQFWTYYEGCFAKDMKWGEGVLKLSNGEQFRGHFERDEINGQGEFLGLGKRVRGVWRQGRLETVQQVLPE